MDTVVIMEGDATAQASTPPSSQDAPTIPCSTFIYFPKLPIELHHKIWKETSFVTRDVCILIKELDGMFLLDSDNDEEDDDSGEELDAFFYATACPHPAILHTCREARTEGLRYYALAFGVMKKSSRLSWKFCSPARTYINWETDRVCLVETQFIDEDDDNVALRHFARLCKKNKLQRIALNVTEGFNIEMLQFLLGRDIHFQEVSLFSAWSRTIKRHVLKKRKAFLQITYGIPAPPPSRYPTVPTKYEAGRYDNGGDIDWQELEHIGNLQDAEEALLELYEKSEKRISKKGPGERKAENPISSRPKIKLCTVQLKLLPKPAIDGNAKI